MRMDGITKAGLALAIIIWGIIVVLSPVTIWFKLCILVSAIVAYISYERR